MIQLAISSYTIMWVIIGLSLLLNVGLICWLITMYESYARLQQGSDGWEASWRVASTNEIALKRENEIKTKEEISTRYELGKATNQIYELRAQIRKFIGPARQAINDLENSMLSKADDKKEEE